MNSQISRSGKSANLTWILLLAINLVGWIYGLFFSLNRILTIVIQNGRRVILYFFLFPIASFALTSKTWTNKGRGNSSILPIYSSQGESRVQRFEDARLVGEERSPPAQTKRPSMANSSLGGSSSPISLPWLRVTLVLSNQLLHGWWQILKENFLIEPSLDKNFESMN